MSDIREPNNNQKTFTHPMMRKALSSDEGEITLPITENSPGSLDEDDVVFSYMREPDDDAKYKSKLSSLYTNEILKTVQKGIITLFQKKTLEESSVSLNSKVKSLMKLDIGDFIVPFYEERILKKGMWILREDIKEDEGENLLISLADIWNYFYTELLPTLQVILCSVQSYKNLTIKERTLIAFRDEMLLKTRIRGSILLVSRSKHRQQWGDADDCLDERVVTAIEQMFLVLLSVSTPSHRQYFELETLAAQVINPLMTARGVYYDGKVTPMAPSRPRSIKKAISSGNLKMEENMDRTFTLPRIVAPKHGRQKSQPAFFLKELFSAGSSYISESKLIGSTRSRAQSQSDIL